MIIQEHIEVPPSRQLCLKVDEKFQKTFTVPYRISGGYNGMSFTNIKRMSLKSYVLYVLGGANNT